MPFKKIEGVLLNFNEGEREAFARLLDLAEMNLGDFGRLSKGDHQYYSREVSQGMAKAVIEGLREELGLKPEKEEESTEDREKRRRISARLRDDHHVSRTVVRCVYDRCNETYRVFTPFGGKAEGYAWDGALENGWRIMHPEVMIQGVPGTDLACPNKHDKHGCVIYTDEQDCDFWPHPEVEI